MVKSELMDKLCKCSGKFGFRENSILMITSSDKKTILKSLLDFSIYFNYHLVEVNNYQNIINI